ncbi:MAG: hypothetical protein LBQ83_04170 [Candidatus Margulisbacteria bacterium]|nr:hypothetical protein [Candidatus Margulisiibacteriota bacterium]
MQARLPIGTILMYDGTGWVDNSTLPGWYQCNGSNGTPDLRNRFIMGSTTRGQYDRTDTTNNSLTLTANHLPKHKHSFTGTEVKGYLPLEVTSSTALLTSLSGVFKGDTDKTKNTVWHGGYGGGYGGINFSMKPTGTTDDNTTTNTAIDKRPAWYSVIFIKRVS